MAVGIYYESLCGVVITSFLVYFDLSWTLWSPFTSGKSMIKYYMAIILIQMMLQIVHPYFDNYIQEVIIENKDIKTNNYNNFLSYFDIVL